MRMVLVFLALCAAACGSTAAPAAPSAAVRPLVALGGQSNAVGLWAPLERRVAVVGSAHNGENIEQWAVGMPWWTELLAALSRGSIDAFVWDQGETNVGGLAAGLAYGQVTPTYQAQLTDLVARVRAAARDPRLLVIVIGPTDYGGPTFFAGLRAAQEAFVAADPHAVYLRSNDLEADEGGLHLTPKGYEDLAGRVVAALSR